MNTKQNTELPYERFFACGASALTNAELLAIILRTGTGGASALDLARKVLTVKDAENTGLRILWDADLRELTSIGGIGEVKAVKLLCLGEIARRLAGEKAQASLSFEKPSSVAASYMERMRHLSREQALLLMLDNKLRLVKESVLSVGTVRAVFFSPREIFMEALRAGAVNIILLHNHPSGDPSPSGEDIRVTKTISEGAALLEIPLLDHIIIGDGTYYSMKESGVLN